MESTRNIGSSPAVHHLYGFKTPANPIDSVKLFFLKKIVLEFLLCPFFKNLIR